MLYSFLGWESTYLGSKGWWRSKNKSNHISIYGTDYELEDIPTKRRTRGNAEFRPPQIYTLSITTQPIDQFTLYKLDIL